MTVSCVWEHNGEDTLLYADAFPGAFTRGSSLKEAVRKMPGEIRAYLRWRGESVPDDLEVEICQKACCDLQIRDADSDVLFDSEKAPLSLEEYIFLRDLTLRSAKDFLALYSAVPNKELCAGPVRSTFYGSAPRTAEEMYIHTRSVNSYYFSEIGVDADNEGTILECRQRGFKELESVPDFLDRPPEEGSWGEWWSLRKVLRRFLWHDRIHAKAMYRMLTRTFPGEEFPDPYFFSTIY